VHDGASETFGRGEYRALIKAGAEARIHHHTFISRIVTPLHPDTPIR
jgi:hypothetical protein